jgi:hypothetical protein
MKESRSQRNRAENEVVFKDKNVHLQALASSVLDGQAKKDLPIGFLCECSNEACRAIIKLTLAEFDSFRKNRKQFIIKPGHVALDIEHVVRRAPDYDVVEKFEAPPSRESSRLHRE